MNSVEGFLNLVKKDKGLQDLISKVDNKLGKTGKDEEIIKNEVLPVAKERGFNFTAKEFLDYINVASKNSSSGDTNTKKSTSTGTGKKIMAVVLGGATLGGGGMFAFKQMQNMNKPQAAQVQSIENDANNDSTVNAQEAETAVENDGLRPEENNQDPGQQSDKTSEKLKGTLDRAPSKAKDQQNENPDKKEATPAQSKAPVAPKQNQHQGSPKITKEEVDEINQFLDAVINNTALKDKSGKVITEHMMDEIIANTEKMGQKVTDEQKKELLDVFKKVRNEASDEEKVMFMQMMAAQAAGGAAGQAPAK